MQNYALINQTLESLYKEVDRNAIAMKEVALKDIWIKNPKVIVYKDIEIPLKNKAFNDLLKFLSLSNSTIKRLNKVNESGSKLIELMRNVVSNTSSKTNVYLCMDNERSIFAILTNPSQFKQVPTDTAKQIVDRLLNQSNKVSIDNKWSNSNSWGINISFDDFVSGIPNMPDEVFKFGFSLENSVKGGVTLSPYNQRLVCSNGMITRTNMTTFNLSKNDDVERYVKFFEGVNKMKKNGILAGPFLEKMKKAIETQASVAEMELAKKALNYNSNVGSDLDLFIPWEAEKSRYQSKGYDIETLDPYEKSIAKSDMTVSELVNALTDFASHNYMYDITESQRANIQIKAGQLMGKIRFDTENLKLATLFS